MADTEETFKRLIYRVNTSPGIPLPFGARSAGHYRFCPERIEEGRNKNFVQLFWGIQGKGEFTFRNKTFVLQPSQVFLYLPGDRHYIRTVSRVWEYRWLTLDGPVNVQTVKALGLGRKVVQAGECPQELFIQLEACLRDVSPNGERRASAIAYSVLTRACGSIGVIRREENAVGECVELMEQRYEDPLLSVNELSIEVELNRSSLTRVFKKKMGMSPKEYLNSLRLQKAMSLLKETDMRISEIAYRCGYEDPNYFARIFKKTIGMVPTDFRQD